MARLVSVVLLGYIITSNEENVVKIYLSKKAEAYQNRAYSMREIGEFFGVSRITVSQAVKKKMKA